jgi:hypothetical protein
MVIRKISEKNIKLDPKEAISRGADVVSDTKVKTHKKRILINVGIPENMLHEIDQELENRVGISRTGWILEAIHEKLKSLQ